MRQRAPTHAHARIPRTRAPTNPTTPTDPLKPTAPLVPVALACVPLALEPGVAELVVVFTTVGVGLGIVLKLIVLAPGIGTRTVPVGP